MNRKFSTLLFTCCILLLLSACGNNQTPEPTPNEAASNPKSSDARTILVSLKQPSEANAFWAKVAQAAIEKGEELGANVVLVAPHAQDIQMQISQIEEQLTQGVSAIVVAPIDPDALAPVLQKAKKQGVPVLFTDTKGKLDDTTFIGTNHEMGALLAAEYICFNLAQGSEVAILQGIPTESIGRARAHGNKTGLEGCGMKVVAEMAADWERAKGQTAMGNILTVHPNVKAVIAANDDMALGAVEAIKAAGLVGKITVVGFDANPDAADAILQGEMAATIAQNPTQMGAFGVENAIKLIKGEVLPEVIDTGTLLVDKNNASRYGTGQVSANETKKEVN